MSEKTAVCRGCGMKLIGQPYLVGGGARHPKTNELCRAAFWGGYVCSPICYIATDSRQKQSIDDHATRQHGT